MKPKTVIHHKDGSEVKCAFEQELFKSLKAVNPRGQMERQPSSKKKREDSDSAVQMGR